MTAAASRRCCSPALALSACAARGSGPATPATPAAAPIHGRSGCSSARRAATTCRAARRLRVQANDRGSVRASVLVGGRALPWRRRWRSRGAHRPRSRAAGHCTCAALVPSGPASRSPSATAAARSSRASAARCRAIRRRAGASSARAACGTSRSRRGPARQALATRSSPTCETRSGPSFDKNFPPTINTVNYSAPIWTATADQQTVPVKLVGSRVSYGQALAKVLAGGVPIPRGAREAWGGDHHLVVWQPSTDTMWELWGRRRPGAAAGPPSGAGGWTTCRARPATSPTPAASSRARRPRACRSPAG